MSILNSGILFAIGLLARATVILGAASIAMLALRRASAATRHRVGTAGLGLALLLPSSPSFFRHRRAARRPPLGLDGSAPRLRGFALALGFGRPARSWCRWTGRRGLRVRRLASEPFR